MLRIVSFMPLSQQMRICKPGLGFFTNNSQMMAGKIVKEVQKVVVKQSAMQMGKPSLKKKPV
jgi:hypothetical protein